MKTTSHRTEKTKRVLCCLLVLLCCAPAATAQDVDSDGLDCPLEPLPTLSAKERKELKKNLESHVDLWKTIGPSGQAPALVFRDLNDERLFFDAEYELDDSTAQQFTSNYPWLRIATLYEATHRLSDIFGMAAQLGLSVVVHAHIKLPHGDKASIGTYNNATLRRILAMEDYVQAYIYSDLVTLRRKMPLPVYDSMYLTSANYCNHLYTIHLHSVAQDDPTVASQFFWMVNNNRFIANNEFFEVLAMDDTRLRIVGSQEGSTDTVTLEYTPEQLIGEEPAIDVNLAGQYIALSLGKACPIELPDSTGVWNHCSYDPTLKVVVFHYTVTELSLLNIEGKEDQLKTYLLNNLLATEGEDFLMLLAVSELGLEMRWQSRTTPRKATITFTPDELYNYLIEE